MIRGHAKGTRLAGAAAGALMWAMAADGGAPIPDFMPGDIYLASSTISGSVTRGVIRIDPFTWLASPVITFLPTEVPGFHGRIAYDAWRGRLVTTDTSTALTLIDPNGVRTPLPYTWTQVAYDVAPTRDGRVYITSTFAGPAIPRLAFIDVAGATHEVMNAAGTGPYVLNVNIEAIHFDPATNSVIAAIDQPGTPNVGFRRLSLSANGGRVIDDSAQSTFAVSPAGPSVQNLGRGPDGMLFAKVDDNSNDPHPRMLLVDPTTLGVMVYATSSYFGVGGEMAGCHTPTANGAVVLDTLNDQLRLFTLGSSGAGSVLPTTGVSGSGSNENAQLIVIAPRACAGDASGDGVIDFVDLNIVLSQFGLTGSALIGDIDHDGDVDFADLNGVLSAFGTTC